MNAHLCNLLSGISFHFHTSFLFLVLFSHLTHAAQLDSTAPLNLPTYFGINGVGMLHHPNDKAENSRRWELMSELRVKWDRSDFWWSELEKQPGKWTFGLGDRSMQTYRDHDVQIFPILNYGAKWRDGHAPASAEERNEFGNYVTRVVSRYSRYASYWEVWNEPNIVPFWTPEPNPDLYAALLRMTYEKAHAANPDVKIVGFAMADLDQEFLERVLEVAGAKCFDAVSYHFYRISQPEQRTLDEVAEARLNLDRFGSNDVPIWVTEMGVTSHLSTEGVSEDLQAIYWMRQVLLCIAGGAERVFPFCLVDNAWDPGGPWGSQLGMVTLEGRKKPSFYAYKTMIAELQNYKLAGSVDLGKDVYAYLFTLRESASDAVQNKLVAWTTRDARDIRIQLDDVPTTIPRPGTVEALTSIPAALKNYTTLLGETHPLEFDGATARVMLSPSPIYMPVKSARLFENAQSRFEPAAILASFTALSHSALRLPVSASSHASVTIAAPEGWEVLVHSDPKTPEHQVFTRAPSDAKPGWYTLHASITDSSGTLDKQLRVWLREPLRVQVRPFVTSTSKEIVTSFTIHNRALPSAMNYEFTSEPDIPGIILPSGQIGSAEGIWEGREDGTGPYFQQAQVHIPRNSLAALKGNLRIRLHTSTQSASGTLVRDEHTVFRFAVMPLVQAPPVIDGDLKEFASVPKMMLNDPGQVLTGEWRTHNFDSGDASAAISAIWTEDGLYLGCEITDDHPMMNDQGAGQTIYKGDAVEVYLCPNGYWGQHYANPENGAFHFALSPGRGGTGALVSNFEKEVPRSKIAVRRTKAGYNMEAFLPKSAFGNYSPQHDDIIGWDVQLDDKDDYSETAKQKALMWNGDNMNWLRAAKWGMAVVQ